MDERARRLWAGTEADAIGWGGVAAVARATGMAISTVRKGRDEARAGATPEDVVKVRRSGGKRPYEVAHPEVWPALEKLVDPMTRGDPESPLRWTCKSTHALSAELFARHGIRSATRRWPSCCTSTATACRRRTRPSKARSIPTATRSSSTSTRRPQDCIERGVPVISVDTKKKELVGNFKNGGREWQPQGRARAGRRPRLSVAMRSARRSRTASTTSRANDGFVSVGIDHDTPVFAVTSIEAWWKQVGAKRYPEAREIFITADAGGSNGYRSHVWKHELQRVADKLDLVDPRQPLPAGHEQVEQDRAPPVLLHLDQLARAPAADLRDRRQPHRQHDQPRRPRRARPTRPSQLPDRQEDLHEGTPRAENRAPTTSTATGTTSSGRATIDGDRSTSPFPGP